MRFAVWKTSILLVLLRKSTLALLRKSMNINIVINLIPNMLYLKIIVNDNGKNKTYLCFKKGVMYK